VKALASIYTVLTS